MSVGVQAWDIGELSPDRQSDLASLGFRSLIGALWPVYYTLQLQVSSSKSLQGCFVKQPELFVLCLSVHKLSC